MVCECGCMRAFYNNRNRNNNVNDLVIGIKCVCGIMCDGVYIMYARGGESARPKRGQRRTRRARYRRHRRAYLGYISHAKGVEAEGGRGRVERRTVPSRLPYHPPSQKRPCMHRDQWGRGEARVRRRYEVVCCIPKGRWTRGCGEGGKSFGASLLRRRRRH